jgi:NADH-quinone oxidoreductase subunit E
VSSPIEGTATPRHLAPATLAKARDIVALYPEPRSALIPLCHLAQGEEGWLTPEAMDDIAALLGIDPTEVLGTATFYDMLHTEPVGRYLVSVCTNIACLLDGAVELLEHAEGTLGVGVGGTTADGLVTLEEAECLADCDRTPCVQVNHRFVGAQTPESFDRLVAELRAGSRDTDIPPHGTLNRVERSGGLQADPERVATERAAMAEAQATRSAAASGRSDTGSSGS